MAKTDNKIHTPVSRLMTTDFAAVDPSDTLGEAVDRMTEKAAGSALRTARRDPHVPRHPPRGRGPYALERSTCARVDEQRPPSSARRHARGGGCIDDG
jgi:hypothetical protein